MSILPTYPDGYSGGRKTLVDIRQRWDVKILDPEFRQRVFAMMKAARRAGHDLGIGGGGRSADQQRALFLARHHPSPTGSIVFEGQRWALNPGAAPAAPPGRSYHENDAGDRGGLAVDMIGDLAWMNANCAWFGLRHFAGVNGEPWHVQPAEVPTSRSAYDRTPLVDFVKRRKAPR